MELGLGTGPGGPGAFHGRNVGVRVNLVEGLALLDNGAFGKELLLQDAAHLGTNLGLAEGTDTAGELGREGDLLGDELEDGHFAHALAAALFLIRTGGKADGQAEHETQGQDRHKNVSEGKLFHQKSARIPPGSPGGGSAASVSYFG